MAVPRLGSSIAELFGFSDMSWFGTNSSANDTQILATTTGLLNWTSASTTEAPTQSRSFSPPAIVHGFYYALQRSGSLDGVFGYLLSKWAVSTVLMVRDIVLRFIVMNTLTLIRGSFSTELMYLRLQGKPYTSPGKPASSYVLFLSSSL